MGYLMGIGNKNLLIAIGTALVLSACGSYGPVNNAPVVSGTNTSGGAINTNNGYGYNNGTITTPNGTYSNGAINTNNGYGYNNGTITTPNGTYNSDSGTYVHTPYANTNVQTEEQNTLNNNPYTQNNASSVYDNNVPYTPNTSYTKNSVNSGTYRPSQGNYSPVNTNATYHRVVLGDTVFNISKRYNISQDNLREWNNLSGNNIYIGQNLRVKSSAHTAAASVSSKGASGVKTHRVVKGDTLYNIAKRYGVTQQQIRKWNNLPNDNVPLGGVLRVSSAMSTHYVAPSVSNQAVVSNNESLTKASQNMAPPTSQTVIRTVASIQWQTPLLNAKVERLYDYDNKDRSVKLQGNAGQSVLAAADGIVIFVGNNPSGYGQMVVMQHLDKYITVYSNVASLLVKERDKIKRGQTIAMTPSDGYLHFEMRHKGKRLDPSDYIKL